MNRSFKNRFASFIGVFSMVLTLCFTACEPGPGRTDTESDQNFEGESDLPQTELSDTTTAPAGIRDDSTPAADNPDLDDNPVIDKGVNPDSSMSDDN